ncbi:MOSC domain-containing protein [Actinokineospora enzanensis]|uniref:MOSC domain-containing protein n=1 Tax=Actinokineospora enzanensis TaxID=155975 RepID=UPI0003664937|nr:MOSC domain-containing protein [Actinokineospora enzanensis]
MQLLSVNIATVRTDAWAGRVGRTGIDKRPVTGPVQATEAGLAGDTICDTKHHGGVDRAAYAYAEEDQRWWSTELGRPVSPGSFGENLTTSGLDITGARIGEHWAIGTAVFEVRGPRTPCRVFAGFWDVPDLIHRFLARGWPGAYLRVLQAGEVTAGDPITVIHRPDHDIDLGTALRALTTTPDLLARLRPVVDLLPEDAGRKVRKRLSRLTAGV